MVIENMFAPNDFTNVKRQDIESMEPSKVSMMPEGLMNSLKEDEIQDLVAFLLSRGDRTAKRFTKDSCKNNFGFWAHSPSPRLRGRSRSRRAVALSQRVGAAKARPSPTRLGEASGAAWVGWERENRPPSVGVSNRLGSWERRGWLFLLPSDVVSV